MSILSSFIDISQGSVDWDDMTLYNRRGSSTLVGLCMELEFSASNPWLNMHLVTERLIIRPLRPEDECDYCRLLAEPALAARLVGSAGADGRPRLIAELDDTEIAHLFAERLTERIADAVSRYAITLRDDDHLIGSIGCYAIDAEAVGLSYWIAVRWQGCGYGTEAPRAFIEPALGLYGRRTMLANVAADNPASLRAAEKAGFRAAAREAPAPGRRFLEVDLNRAGTIA